MAKPYPPFALIDKQAVLGGLEAVGSHDPDLLDQERTELLRIARTSWIGGAVLMFVGSWVCYSSLGLPGGLPIVAVAAWLMQRGKRNSVAVREAFAAYERGATVSVP